MISLPQELSPAAAARKKAMAMPSRRAIEISKEQVSETGNNGRGSRKALQKNRPSSSTTFAGPSVSDGNDRLTTSCFRQSPSLSADFLQSSLRMLLEQTLNQEQGGQFSMESLSRSPYDICKGSTDKTSMNDTKVLRTHRRWDRSLSSSTSRRKVCGIPWHWSGMHKERRIKVTDLSGRRSLRAASGAKQRRDFTDTEVTSSEEDSTEAPLMSHEITDLSSNSVSLDCYHCKHPNQSKVHRNSKDYCGKAETPQTRTLSLKYQPKHFNDIVGHKIVVQALSNAIQQEKVAPLYLFYGPGGTGKTSTAKIFAMACNCESNSPPKPCWSCKGCSRSLSITALCSGSRRSGFQRIRTTLLQSTSFTQTVPGFKVFIIEECHALSVEDWAELLSIVGGYSSVVFVIITEDANMVPRAVSSRCQKFCFPKLKDIDIAYKIARIVDGEDIKIENDAVKMITLKAEGSLREAENILDQLGLLGSKIASSTVQQLVGLVPDSKLMDLLEMAILADTVKTVRCTRELIASGVEPLSLVSQLASLITDILAGTSSSKDKRLQKNQTQLMKNRSGRLHQALKILIDTEKQLRSATDHVTWVIAALLQFASEDKSSCDSLDIVLPKTIRTTDDTADSGSGPELADINRQRVTNLVCHNNNRIHHLTYGIAEQLDIEPDNLEVKISKCDENAAKCMGKMAEIKPDLAQITDIEEVWQDILLRIESRYIKDFLNIQAKLVSLTVSRANAIVHLMFKHPEDKLAAETSERTISDALKKALGCPVTVNISLEPAVFEVLKTTTFSTIPARSRQQKTFLPTADQPQDPEGRDVVELSLRKKPIPSLENTSRRTRSTEIIQMVQGHDEPPSEAYEESIARHSQNEAFSGLLKQRSRDDSSPGPDQIPFTKFRTMDMPSVKRAARHKHRMLSLSSFQPADASVEPYSQDLLFENRNPDRRLWPGRNTELRDGFSKAKEHKHHETQHMPKAVPLSRTKSQRGIFIGTKIMVKGGQMAELWLENEKREVNNTWSCTDMFCRGETKVKENGWKEIRDRYVLRCTPCTDFTTTVMAKSKKAQLYLRKTMPASL